MGQRTIPNRAFIRCAAAMFLAGAMFLQGCDSERRLVGAIACSCVKSFEFHAVEVRDADGRAVGSASIRIFRVSDGMEIPDGASQPRDPGPGKAIIFSDSQYEYFPGGAATMDIRVVASKGGKSGEGTYTLAWDHPDCRCNIGEVAGPDTLVLR